MKPQLSSLVLVFGLTGCGGQGTGPEDGSTGGSEGSGETLATETDGSTSEDTATAESGLEETSAETDETDGASECLGEICAADEACGTDGCGPILGSRFRMSVQAFALSTSCDDNAEYWVEVSGSLDGEFGETEREADCSNSDVNGVFEFTYPAETTGEFLRLTTWGQSLVRPGSAPYQVDSQCFGTPPECGVPTVSELHTGSATVEGLVNTIEVAFQRLPDGA